MALNIKNQETYLLIEELAKVTGENMTEAVTRSVRERLARVQGERKAPLAERLLRIGKNCASHLKEPYRSIDHGELLYDEKGLPR
jgi:antitoxin VapB